VLTQKIQGSGKKLARKRLAEKSVAIIKQIKTFSFTGISEKKHIYKT
jgi:hypothetical protein